MFDKKIKSILYIRLPCWKIYPGGMIYVADYIHKKQPLIKQSILDLALVEPAQRKQMIKRYIAENQPDAVAFSWRNMQTFGPNPDNDALDIVMAYDHSPILKERIRAASGAISIIAEYVSMRINNFKYMRMVRNMLPESKIIVGGTAVSLFAKYVIKKCPTNTFAVIGEGEDTMLSIINGTKPDGDYFYKDKEGLVHYNQRDRFFDLKEMTAVDFHYIRSIFPEFDEYLDDYVGVQTKRGCPYKCLFCLYTSIEGTGMRFRNPEEVAKEVQLLEKDFGVKKVWFTDAQFCSTRKSYYHAELVLDGLLERKTDISWTGYLRLDHLDQSLASKMIKTGICSIDTTFTGSQEIADKLQLGYKVNRQMESFDMFKKGGLTDQKLKLYMPLNAPGENRRTLKETLSKINSLYDLFGREQVLPFIFFIGIQPDTPVERLLIEQGYLKEGYNPLTYNPFSIKKLLYNPAPLGRSIGRAYLKALNQEDFDYVGRATMDYLEQNLEYVH